MQHTLPISIYFHTSSTAPLHPVGIRAPSAAPSSFDAWLCRVLESTSRHHPFPPSIRSPRARVVGGSVFALLLDWMVGGGAAWCWCRTGGRWKEALNNAKLSPINRELERRMPLAYFMNSTCRVVAGRGPDGGGYRTGGNPVNYYTLAKTTEDSRIEESNNKCMMVDDEEEEEELKVDRTRIPA